MKQSDKLLQCVDEMNGKMLAKAGKKIVSGGKKVGSYLKDSAVKSADTARNAIVAGAVAPVGAGIAAKYRDKQPAKKEEKKYTASDVAALAASMRKTDESYLNEDLLAKLKGDLADFARAESEAYLKAKELIDKAKKDKALAQKEISNNHPYLSAISAGVEFYGQTFFSIFLGLLLLGIFSGKNLSLRNLLQGILKYTHTRLINQALMLIGIVGGVNVVSKILDRNSSVKERLETRLQMLEARKKESGAKKIAKGAGKGAAIGGAVGAVGGAALGGKIAKGVLGKRRTSLGAKIVRRGLKGGLGAAGGAIGLARGAMIGGAAAGIAHLAKKKKEADRAKRRAAKNEALSFENRLLIEALEDAIWEVKILSPAEQEERARKRAERRKARRDAMTPQQKAEAAAKRKARRAARKGATAPVGTKANPSPVKTSQGPKSIQGTINKPASSTTTVKKPASTTTVKKKTTSGTTVQKKKPAGSGTSTAAKKTVNKTVNKTVKNANKATKTVTKAAKKSTAQNLFAKAKTFGTAKKATLLKRGLKGAAITAGLGAAAYGVHKFANRNKK